jgi:hypothetical protein
LSDATLRADPPAGAGAGAFCGAERGEEPVGTDPGGEPLPAFAPPGGAPLFVTALPRRSAAPGDGAAPVIATLLALVAAGRGAAVAAVASAGAELGNGSCVAAGLGEAAGVDSGRTGGARVGSGLGEGTGVGRELGVGSAVGTGVGAGARLGSGLADARSAGTARGDGATLGSGRGDGVGASTGTDDGRIGRGDGVAGATVGSVTRSGSGGRTGTATFAGGGIATGSVCAGIGTGISATAGPPCSALGALEARAIGRAGGRAAPALRASSGSSPVGGAARAGRARAVAFTSGAKMLTGTAARWAGRREAAAGTAVGRVIAADAGGVRDGDGIGANDTTGDSSGSGGASRRNMVTSDGIRISVESPTRSIASSTKTSNARA